MTVRWATRPSQWSGGPASNSQPSFPDDEEDTPDSNELDRAVKETAKAGSSVGNPVVASDANNDPLLYTLAGTSAVATFTTSTASADVDNNPCTNADHQL